ncbi:MAG TPA: DNA polymerase IV, partial [Saprospiraceae bacterium]|nr:DNA polymerase IV [Saprospiraceae bacterium]
RTFQTDTTDVKRIKNVLTNMIMALAFDLRKSGKLTSCITVKIRYTDFNTYTMQKRISYTAQDKELIAYAHELFDKLYQRRQLIRLVGVRFSGLVRGCYQISLFDDTAEDISLLQQLDRIRTRFGSKAIGRAASVF